MPTATFATLEEVISQPRPERAFVTNPGEGRLPETLDVFGNRMTVKISSRDTGGTFAVMESITPPLSGPPLHIHHDQDEWWHVLEGNYRFEVDGREIVAGPGAHVYAPRGTRHTFQNLGKEPAKMIVAVVPGGLDLFFEEISANAVCGKPDPAKLAPIFEHHGLSLVGPPLSLRRTSNS
jgi:mannose-6-phosphate isomerase-like protein (cupin superfamily)